MTAKLSHIESSQKVPDDYPRYESLVHMLQAAVDARPDNTAIICGDESIDYATLGRAVAGLADELTERGCRDSRVAILAPNCIEHVVTFFAAMAREMPTNR